MYNCTKLHTGLAIAWVTKDRAARPHLPSTVENQLGRRRQRRQLLIIAQWNVRTLLDREGTNRPERHTALVAMELAKYNIDIAALCETRFSESGSLNDKQARDGQCSRPMGGEGNSTPDEEWAALQQVVYNTAKTYLGKPDRKHQDWFDPNDQELQTLMSRINKNNMPSDKTILDIFDTVLTSQEHIVPSRNIVIIPLRFHRQIIILM